MTLKRNDNHYEDALLEEPISQTFFEQLFCTEVFWPAFMCLQFGFVILWSR